MSHFSVLVIGDDVAGQLAPFHEFECTGENDQYVEEIDQTDEARKTHQEGHADEPFVEWAEGYYGRNVVTSPEQVDRDGAHKYGYILVVGDDVRVIDRTNPNARWDWWVVGGRWGGAFRLKSGKEGVLGDPSTFDLIRGDSRDHTKVDQAKKADIDFEAMIQEVKDRAASDWDKFWAEAQKYPWPACWDVVREKHPGDIERARQEYHAQPGIKEVQEVCGYTFRTSHHESFGQDRAAYIERRGAETFVTFAVVKEGTWYEKGKMGWWGMVSDEKERDRWNEEFSKLLNSIPDETVLTMVDCHI